MAKDSEKGNSKRLAMLHKYGLNPKKLYSDLSIPDLVEFSIRRKGRRRAHSQKFHSFDREGFSRRHSQRPDR